MHLRSGFIVSTIAVLVVACCGCGGESYDSVPVSGTVTHKGTPVEGATVAFHGGSAKVPATGVTDASGKFKLSSYKPDDGAPAGSYRVTVTKKKLEGGGGTGPSSMEEAAAKSGGPAAKETDLLPAKYADQEMTPLTATVEKGKTNDVTLTLED
jgi:hypothetical protein